MDPPFKFYAIVGLIAFIIYYLIKKRAREKMEWKEGAGFVLGYMFVGGVVLAIIIYLYFGVLWVRS